MKHAILFGLVLFAGTVSAHADPNGPGGQTSSFDTDGSTHTTEYYPLKAIGQGMIAHGQKILEDGTPKSPLSDADRKAICKAEEDEVKKAYKDVVFKNLKEMKSYKERVATQKRLGSRQKRILRAIGRGFNREKLEGDRIAAQAHFKVRVGAVLRSLGYNWSVSGFEFVPGSGAWAERETIKVNEKDLTVTIKSTAGKDESEVGHETRADYVT